MADLAEELVARGYEERREHRLAEARRSYEEAAALFRTAGNELRLAHTVRHVGDILRQDGRWREAEPYYLEALQLYRRNADARPLDVANMLRGLALLRDEEARALWAEARDLYAGLNLEAGVAECAKRLEAER